MSTQALRDKKEPSTVLGTPEFMAPELYTEIYTETVDIYAFGLVMLEMISRETPYSECTNIVMIINKVSAGIEPDLLERVKDSELREFVRYCLKKQIFPGETEERRPSAKEVNSHNFMTTEDFKRDSCDLVYSRQEWSALQEEKQKAEATTTSSTTTATGVASPNVKDISKQESKTPSSKSSTNHTNTNDSTTATTPSLPTSNNSGTANDGDGHKVDTRAEDQALEEATKKAEEATKKAEEATRRADELSKALEEAKRVEREAEKEKEKAEQMKAEHKKVERKKVKPEKSDATNTSATATATTSTTSNDQDMNNGGSTKMEIISPTDTTYTPATATATGTTTGTTINNTMESRDGNGKEGDRLKSSSIENPEDVEKDDSCYNGDSKNCEESEPSSKTNSQKEMLRLVEEARERDRQKKIEERRANSPTQVAKREAADLAEFQKLSRQVANELNANDERAADLAEEQSRREAAESIVSTVSTSTNGAYPEMSPRSSVDISGSGKTRTTSTEGSDSTNDSSILDDAKKASRGRSDRSGTGGSKKTKKRRRERLTWKIRQSTKETIEKKNSKEELSKNLTLAPIFSLFEVVTEYSTSHKKSDKKTTKEAMRLVFPFSVLSESPYDMVSEIATGGCKCLFLTCIFYMKNDTDSCSTLLLSTPLYSSLLFLTLLYSSLLFSPVSSSTFKIVIRFE